MSNEKWSQKPIITNPTESTRICLIDGNPIIENKTISIDNLLATSNKSLDLMPQLFYRNLEGDNMLANNDFDGRVRAVETTMKIVYISVDRKTIIVENVPHIKDLKENPGNWMLASPVSYTTTIKGAIRISSVSYIGDYETSTNCIEVVLIKAAPATWLVGNISVVLSFLAGGLVLQWDNTFKSSAVSGTWNNQLAGCGYSWKDSSGKYKAIVTNITGDPDLKDAYKAIIFESDTSDRLGTWTRLGTDGLTGYFDDLLPEGYVGFNSFMQGIKHPLNSNYNLIIVGMYTSAGTLDKFAAIVFDNDLNHKQLTVLDIDYSFVNSINQYGYGLATAFYKGEYLFSIQDGQSNSGKRVILKSKYLEGPYTLHSTIFDFSTVELKQPGSMIGNSIANSSIFVFNNELYCFSSGEGLTDFSSGNNSLHEVFLWKFNDSQNTWNFVKGPVVISLHGDNDNYPEYPGIGAHHPSLVEENGGWAKAHMGMMQLHYVENNRLWIGYAARGFGLNTTPTYQSTIGYIDLAKALN